MTLLDRLDQGLKARSADPVLRELFGGLTLDSTESGEHVSIEKSIGLPAVFAAISLIANVGGTLPLSVYGDDEKRAKDHPAYKLLHNRPNPGADAATFWPDALTAYSGWGNTFIGKERMGNRVVALHLMQSGMVDVKRKDGKITFIEHRGSDRVRWSSDDVIHVRNISLDGLTGLSPIGVARESMGAALAMRKGQNRFFRDLAIPPGVLSVKDDLKPETQEKVRAEWKKRHQDRRDIAILSNGATFETISIPMADAQFVELAGLGVADVARIYNMPASMIGAGTGDSFTYGNRESDMRLFSTTTLAGPLMRFESALTNDRELLGTGFYSRFVREALLQADYLTRMQGYRLATGGRSWMLPSEVREREDLPADVDLPDDEPQPTTIVPSA